MKTQFKAPQKAIQSSWKHELLSLSLRRLSKLSSVLLVINLKLLCITKVRLSSLPMLNIVIFIKSPGKAPEYEYKLLADF